MLGEHAVQPVHGLQPTLNDELVVLRAPTQVWSGLNGDMGAERIHGVTYSDVRILRGMTVTVAGRTLEHLATTPLGPDRAEIRSMVRDEVHAEPDPDVLVTRVREVDGHGWSETLTVNTRRPTPMTARVEVRLLPDATYIDAIKRGVSVPPRVAIDLRADGAEWSGEGVTTTLRTENVEVALDGAVIVLTTELEVPSRGAAAMHWRVDAFDASTPVAEASDPAGFSLPALEGLDPRLQRWVRKAAADLDALRMTLTAASGRQFLAAGAPWYFTLFGRDSIWSARMLLPHGLDLAKDTLWVLAELQGTSVDIETAEEPGKIIHELRREELIGTDGTVLPPMYYGTVDATPLWVCLLHDCWRAGMADDEVRELLPNVRAALTWLRDYGDVDGDALIEYRDASGHGLTNQGWKDSHDGIQWDDGRLAEGPVTLLEVQAYAYEAALSGADMLERLGDAQGAGEAREWREWAARLRDEFHRRFWITDPGLAEMGGAFPAVALDADKRAVDSLTSNLGHILGTGILDDEQSALVAAHLGSRELDSGYGLRTLSSEASGYWPLSYHGGSIWPHDTAIAVMGLVADGHDDVAAALIEGLLVAADAFGYRIPELYSGEGGDSAPRPIPYPASCRPQAWSAAASFAVVGAVRAMEARAM